MADGFSMDDLAEEDRFYLGDEYKRTVLEHMSSSQLLDMLLIHPTVSVSPSYRDTGLTASYTFKPLSNLVRGTFILPFAVAHTPHHLGPAQLLRHGADCVLHLRALINLVRVMSVLPPVASAAPILHHCGRFVHI